MGGRGGEEGGVEEEMQGSTITYPGANNSGARLPKLCQVGALVKGNFTTSMDSTNTASHKDRDVALGYEQRHVIWNCTRQHK